GRDAVELSLLAGVPLRGSRAHGGQRGHPQARLERAALRARHRGGVPPRRLPGGAVPHRAGRLRHRQGPHRRSAHRRGHPDGQRAGAHRHVEDALKPGGRALLGGQVPTGRGAFYPPTLLAAVDRGMPAFDEETFGPVAAVIRAKDEADALRLANDSPFGLGAALWTKDLARAERLAAQIEAGAVFVNGVVKSDPRLPFGALKRSGYGRELSEYGIREFVNIKSVWIA